MDKLRGWIVSNGYLKTSKFMEIIDLYKACALTLGMSLELVLNNELLMGIERSTCFIHGKKIMQLPDFVLYLDKDIRLAYQLEQMGIRVFNSSRVIGICDDKSQTFQVLASQGINMPKTIIAPLVFKGFEEDSEHYIDAVENELTYPIVIKESYGSFGEQVYLVQNREELIMKRRQLISIPHIYQEFVSSSKGRDVRLNVVGSRVVAGMLRTSDIDFRANVTNGGQMQNYNPPKAFEALARSVCKIIGADFAGVDLLFGKDDEPLLCEVNSNAHIKNIQICTGINVAEYILRHILKEMRQ
ncbi:ATP-grasp domain-containing protein [Cellulosilyticum sp. I15G10I2]|uniref:ATP-grasp domain-containing protein n=1 Tax=Cellulosilyticum sp. I15G10I2 TaxID=1892843 RepID=UPI00085C79BD|nr:RimK family alpha-L-glutamate ligase [Cellulosilyticum sp. I15G10I2]